MIITNITLVNDAVLQHMHLKKASRRADHPFGTDGPIRTSKFVRRLAGNSLMIQNPTT
jgi:hypothetical protein